MQYRLIALDLDGTLLDDQKVLSAENRAALDAASAAGALIVPATGRILRGIPEAVRALPYLRYAIVSNGADVFDVQTGESLYQGYIPLELALRVYDYLDSLPVLYDCYQDEIGWMSQAMYERRLDYFSGEPAILDLVERLRIRVPDLKETLREHGKPLQKLQMYFLPGDGEERQRQLKKLPALFPELKASTSVSNNIELNSVTAGKGQALLALCAYLGIPPEATIAFGDGTNDAELLRAAGVGVAMANSMPALLEAADLVTGSNNASGVAQALRTLMRLSF